MYTYMHCNIIIIIIPPLEKSEFSIKTYYYL